jgi:hypothetical protein
MQAHNFWHILETFYNHLLCWIMIFLYEGDAGNYFCISAIQCAANHIKHKLARLEFGNTAAIQLPAPSQIVPTLPPPQQHHAPMHN